jgi:hypothetical protein
VTAEASRGCSFGVFAANEQDAARRWHGEAVGPERRSPGCDCHSDVSRDPRFTGALGAEQEGDLFGRNEISDEHLSRRTGSEALEHDPKRISKVACARFRSWITGDAGGDSFNFRVCKGRPAALLIDRAQRCADFIAIQSPAPQFARDAGKRSVPIANAEGVDGGITNHRRRQLNGVL